MQENISPKVKKIQSYIANFLLLCPVVYNPNVMMDFIIIIICHV